MSDASNCCDSAQRSVSKYTHRIDTIYLRLQQDISLYITFSPNNRISKLRLKLYDSLRESFGLWITVRLELSTTWSCRIDTNLMPAFEMMQYEIQRRDVRSSQIFVKRFVFLTRGPADRSASQKIPNICKTIEDKSGRVKLVTVEQVLRVTQRTSGRDGRGIKSRVRGESCASGAYRPHGYHGYKTSPIFFVHVSCRRVLRMHAATLVDFRSDGGFNRDDTRKQRCKVYATRDTVCYDFLWMNVELEEMNCWKEEEEFENPSHFVIRPSKMPEVSVDELLAKQSTKAQRGNGGRDLARRKRLYTDVHHSNDKGEKLETEGGNGENSCNRVTWSPESASRLVSETSETSSMMESPIVLLSLTTKPRRHI
ncbi:hypothetical protein APICC_05112 [Apis cerana cerana]|uniref:Uncharacterized protein n=1 Tax=Apis cerana cerana TaxID=94128 RepID=A0A2A3EPD1_APICC|nr:hypothetical protein APICC_05112 [Apis cerana cerana]